MKKILHSGEFVNYEGKTIRVSFYIEKHLWVSRSEIEVSALGGTYDVEVWIPSMGIYKEVSSASNARDYQARRGLIRYRDSETKKTKFCHTLNASGLATSRLVPAIVEQFQNADGSVNVPEVLQPFMGGVKVLYPIKK